MNAYLIAAKANAWEIDQHVARAIEENQPEYMIEAVGRGERFYEEDRKKMMRPHKGFKDFFSLN